MLILSPTQKQIKKYFESDAMLPLPDNWEDFVLLTKIRSGGELKQFKPFDYQKKLIELGEKYRKIIVLKSRQLGITQVLISKFLFDACINPAASSLAFMRNAEDASAISRRCRQMLSSIEKYVIPANDNVGYLKIAGGGDLYFKNSGAQGSRSLDSTTSMLFDESAFVPTIASIYAASSPSGAMTSNCTKYIVSTPSAKSGWYWEQLSQDNGKIDIEELAEAVANDEVFTQDEELIEKYELHQEKGFAYFIDERGACKVIIHYLAHPKYSLIPNFLQQKQIEDGTDEETVEREYNLKFVNTSVAVFDPLLVRESAIGGWEGKYDEEAVYFAGIDTATTGIDYCCCQILKYKNEVYSLVATYAKRKQSSEYHLYQISELLRFYKVKVCGVEVTGGVGQLYYERLEEDFKGKHPHIVRLVTTNDSKAKRIAALNLGLERKKLTYASTANLITELLNFRREGNKLQAAEGHHDDEIMSLSFAYDVATNPENLEAEKFSEFIQLSPKEQAKEIWLKNQEQSQ